MELHVLLILSLMPLLGSANPRMHPFAFALKKMVFFKSMISVLGCLHFGVKSLEQATYNNYFCSLLVETDVRA